jgi:hypothetical protein
LVGGVENQRHSPQHANRTSSCPDVLNVVQRLVPTFNGIGRIQRVGAVCHRTSASGRPGASATKRSGPELTSHLAAMGPVRPVQRRLGAGSVTLRRAASLRRSKRPAPRSGRGRPGGVASRNWRLLATYILRGTDSPALVAGPVWPLTHLERPGQQTHSRTARTPKLALWTGTFAPCRSRFSPLPDHFIDIQSLGVRHRKAVTHPIGGPYDEACRASENRFYSCFTATESSRCS